MLVDICAEDDGSERTHQESGAEGGERQHERDERIGAGKKRGPDCRSVVAEDLKVVHLQRIAEGNTNDASELKERG